MVEKEKLKYRNCQKCKIFYFVIPKYYKCYRSHFSLCSHETSLQIVIDI